MRKIYFITFLFLFPILTQAALVPCGDPGQPECTLCHLFVMANNIIKFIMFTIAPPLAVLMLIVGGVLFFFAGGSPTILEKAKKIITSTFIGLLIIFSAWVIVNTIFAKTRLIKTESLLKWYDIKCEVQLPEEETPPNGGPEELPLFSSEGPEGLPPKWPVPWE